MPNDIPWLLKATNDIPWLLNVYQIYTMVTEWFLVIYHGYGMVAKDKSWLLNGCLWYTMVWWWHFAVGWGWLRSHQVAVSLHQGLMMNATRPTYTLRTISYTLIIFQESYLLHPPKSHKNWTPALFIFWQEQLKYTFL